MKIKTLLLTAVILVVCFSSILAGNPARTGTAGAQVLQIPVAARGAALGGAVIANTHGVEAMLWNPAGVGHLYGTEAMFTHLSYWGDMDLNFAGIATSIEDFGTIGAHAKILSVGDIEETTDDYPNGTGRIFSPSMAVIGVTYSRILTDNVTFGATAKFIREDVFEVSATGVAFDIGFMYDPRWHGLTLGFAIMNYGPEMRFSGSGFNRTVDGRPLSGESAPYDLPSSINMGAAYNFYDQQNHSVTLTGNFRSNNYYQDVYQGGLEYSFDDKYFLRGGYSYADDSKWFYGATLGAGVVLDLGNTDMSFEYTWMQVDDKDNAFDNSQFFTAKVRF